MSKLRKYDNVVLCRAAKLERSSVDLASSSTHAREAPDPGLLRPQRGVRNRLGGSFFHLFQQFFGLFLGCLVLQVAEIILWTTIPIAFLLEQCSKSSFA